MATSNVVKGRSDKVSGGMECGNCTRNGNYALIQGSLTSVTFESGSKLSQIEAYAFQDSGLIEIGIPASVEMVDAGCFLQCESLTSVTFESGSRLSRIEKQAFYETGLIEIEIPSSVEVIGDDFEKSHESSYSLYLWRLQTMSSIICLSDRQLCHISCVCRSQTMPLIVWLRDHQL
jgi:hypothetical protein